MAIRNVSYSTDAFASRDAMVAHARLALRGVRYTGMVGTGLSGSLVIPVLARALRKEWAIIRKPGEQSHAAGSTFEGTIADEWIFVDDFISSGATYERVRNAVDAAARRHGSTVRHIGAYLYMCRQESTSKPWRPAPSART